MTSYALGLGGLVVGLTLGGIMGLLQRLKSEYAYFRGAIRALKRITPIGKRPNRTFPDVMEELADQFGDRPALISDRETFSFRQYNGRANQYARWGRINGIEKGDVVALLMPNRPEYLACWLGITRIGGVVALLNTNLADTSLAHCINIVSPKHVIVADELANQFFTAEEYLAAGAMVWFHGADIEHRMRIDQDLDLLPTTNLPRNERPQLTINDRCLFVYTSGTTGLPKAANISHYRVQSIMYGFSAATAAGPDDRMYVCLPLYHSSGGILAVGTTLSIGGSVVIAEQFSASHFWDDVVDHDCTMFQYIGELCRYLLNSPTHPKEQQHKLRIISGNGLRPDIWQTFLDRFQIPDLLEWYAATEGNAVLFNFDAKPGAVGRIPKWLSHRFAIKVVEFDYDRQDVVRDEAGFCKLCAPGVAGEMISQILNDTSKPSQRFDGYSTSEETNRKILTDVFETGDRWFRTGDLMKRDELGYFYFVDRIGDTFRWKGENVSTAEVSEALSNVPGVLESNVYGVSVPGHDGRAGMASLVVDDAFSLSEFQAVVQRVLPGYARPIFLRFQSELEVTGTFKIKKVDLVRQGFDPVVVSDELCLLSPETRQYEVLDEALHKRVMEGSIRL